MKTDEQINIGIVGLGLIGCSMAIDIKKREFANNIIGIDKNILHASTALNMGIVDKITDIDYAIKNTDIIIVATPVSAAMTIIPYILDNSENILVTDVCSTKEKLVKAIKYHPNRRNYVAAHPMAGTEYSGPWAALSGLFDGKVSIICDSSENSPRAIGIINSLYECLNMRIIFMDSSSHDRHTAFVSHISHISSFALALTVLDKEKNERHIFDLASGGFDSTVRLAKSSADMWVPIFEHNKDNIIAVMDTYIEKLNEFKDCINNYKSDDLSEMIKKSNNIKRVLSK